MKFYTTFFIAILFIGCKTSPKYYTLEGNVVEIVADNGVYSISAVTEDIIKVGFSDNQTYCNKAYAPVLLNSIPVYVTESNKKITIKTDHVIIDININPFQISFLDDAKYVKLKEDKGYFRYGDTTSYKFSLKENEAIYGTGGRALPLNRRGLDFLSYNRPQYGYGWGEESLNYSLPHLMSSEDYMLLFDNPAKGIFDIGKNEKDILEFKTAGGNMVYYYINGNNFDELIKNYTELTGRQSLPPLWTFGHLQSRFGYRSQEEAETILQKALDAGYPVDAMIIDIYWFGPELEDGKMGQLDWDLKMWPDPKGMIQRFKEKGIKTITVSEPFFTRKSQHYQYLSENKYLAFDKHGKTQDIGDFYFGVGGLLDIFNPDAKSWMWNKYKEMKKYGIDGWWVDLGEPEKHPDTMYHATGVSNLVHGVYGHEWAKMLYEGYKLDFPDERLFHMGRAGFAGTQHYGLLPWTGDVGRNWSGFKAQPSMMLSMGISGLGYMHSDAGGFSMSEVDEELYTRWMQFAAFTPIFRPHADQSIPPEPVLWPKEVQNNVKPSVELRYKLLPYNYTLAWENSATGMPLARALFTSYPEISDTVMRQYLWGDDFLVCPVMEPGISSIDIVLPEGKWYDYWTGKPEQSGEKNIAVSMDRIPVYIKAGSIIPESPLVRSTEENTTEDLILNYYYSKENSKSQIYFDDGKTNSYQKGAYQLIKMEVQNDETGFSIITSIEGDGYEGAPKERDYLFNVIGMEAAPKMVVSEEDVAYSWDKTRSTLSFRVILKDNATYTIELL